MKKPEQIGPYFLLSPLGDPARGNLWLARAGAGGDKVALKLARAGDDAGRQRLLHECELAIHFNHPNIVRIHECGGAKGVTWIAMGYIGGPPGALTLANFRQLLLALVHVHGNGVVHADIRRANLLLDVYGDLHLAGFGLARRHGQVPTAGLGTPHVQSPELLRKQPIDTRTDIFTAGVMLYEVLTGKPPFQGSAMETMRQIQHEHQALPSTVAPGLGTSFDEVVRRALARDRDQRYGSVFEFLSEFDAACRRGVRLPA
ncbi:MAG: serine/threonine-protein kinase [Pseudomonadota bacterium]